ncbi:MAG: hypothetical protein LBD41_07295, partial [Clostridiales Family XIII bacterium]|nr:hypothetical protein [Clostridiales Family XIII bacterium]
MSSVEFFGHRFDEKIKTKLSNAELAQIIADKPFRELNSILVEAFKEKATKIRPSDILKRHEEIKEYYEASTIDQRELINFELMFYQNVPREFQAVELSPVTPLGLNSVLTKISQNNSLSAIRNSEVVSDPTTALALECATKRQKKIKDNDPVSQINLATSQRVLRLQPFDKDKGYMQHFTLFALCSGGRDIARRPFMLNATRNHISIWLDFIKDIKNKGNLINEISVNLSDVNIMEQLITFFNIPRNIIIANSLNENYDFFQQHNINLPKEILLDNISASMLSQYGIEDKIFYLSMLNNEIIQPLQTKYPNVKFCFDLNRKAGLGYYKNVCFHIFAKNAQNRKAQLVDGGSVDWL